MTDRPRVRKTYKLFVGGGFPRSESGRSYRPDAAPGVNVARGSRKDLRDAVVAARGAAPRWAGATPLLRGQILYRLAEVMEVRRASLVEELAAAGVDATAACREVDASVDLVVWWAGVPDKLQSLLGSQNSVGGPFFNFSTVEAAGVVGIAAPEQPGLLGLLALLLPVMAGGNTAVVLVSESAPLAGLALGELLAVSDVPAGAVNLLAGERAELLPQLASHRDVDGVLAAGAPQPAVAEAAADNVKRVRWADLEGEAWYAAPAGLVWLEPFVEVKTFWHPVAP